MSSTNNSDPSLRDLFTEALQLWLSVSSGSDYAQIWPLLRQGVQLHPDEAFQVGVHFLKATKPENRAVAVDMLGELAAIDSNRRERISAELLALLQKEVDVDVQWSLLTALGKTEDVSATAALAEWVAGSDVKDLRIQAVRSIANINAEGRHTVAGIDSLIAATTDPEDDVRSWGTQALGSLVEADSDEIREALRRRLFDTDDAARLEAIVGLARRRDIRGMEAVKQALTDATVPRRIFDAAGLLQAPELLPYLERADRKYISDEDFEAVLAACRQEQ